ncbi:CDP-diacylglycerol--glycerol-3-phosphate 3-phosphatidyltransferase [Candidatus Pantoea edessiphila]|uniref:CDP-diacylglycerol--glycerol-3-phosphate 3-phosphatidyltransferase n=1 Tax=Candidatus Pantoea edessiphila TaxID=2044610 RepID=A0A2P5T0H4_9GAMM|nr:CDP-diacylglycerol--glycerol-3-phosphate 3-phosphatidyltransferase [Candidatus Pantoea edessiphila]PPI88098.1 CDP-diacylglycerol--glycerol-3-phosphate 3-phosphatidyltransferase [Candidatus Pantoea edessiphila]
MQLNIPNILTLSRFFLIPFFVMFFYIPINNSTFISTLIFIIAALTDLFDGFLARRWKQTTNFGSVLDPIIDKIMVTIALILVSEHFHICWITIPTMIIISREIIVSALRQWIYSVNNLNRNNNLNCNIVSKISKIKTTLQMLSLIALLWHPNIFIIKIGLILIYMALIFTLWSMFLYIKIFQHILSIK